MPPTPRFSYYLYNDKTPVSDDDNIWRQPLPMSRNLSGGPKEISISHGDYFTAVRTFFINHGLAFICAAAKQHLKQPVKSADIHKIRIRLEKHGEFYHPARIEVLLAQQAILFVLNVAVSQTGIRTIAEEYRNLKLLGDRFSAGFLPRAYGCGEVATAGGRKLSMFLGQWFQGYNEFHISRDQSDKADKIAVWDEDGSRFFLSAEQRAEVYRQAAKILTYYYNVETFKQVSAWHHAAGDFVARMDDNTVDLKLITVRRYAPLFKDPGRLETNPKNTESILQALLIYFLNLSVWMRLDRMDGIGELVWLGPEVVRSTVVGVFDGLAHKPADPVLPGAADLCFKYYLSVCTPEILLELTESILQAIHPAAPEIPVIKQNLVEHVRLLIESIGEL